MWGKVAKIKSKGPSYSLLTNIYQVFTLCPSCVRFCMCSCQWEDIRYLINGSSQNRYRKWDGRVLRTYLGYLLILRISGCAVHWISQCSSSKAGIDNLKTLYNVQLVFLQRMCTMYHVTILVKSLQIPVLQVFKNIFKMPIKMPNCRAKIIKV